jgi:hypothetical protein
VNTSTQPLSASSGYVSPERSGDPVRSGTLFPVVIARWQHWTAGWSFERLVAMAGKCFAEALEGKTPDDPHQMGPADVAALLTIIDERRRTIREAELRALAGLIDAPDVHDVDNSVENRA